MNDPFVKLQTQTLSEKPTMITLLDLAVTNRRAQSPSVLVDLANALKGSESVRAEDPIQVWEAHSIISKYLDKLGDRDIVTAIDLHNGLNY